MAKSVFGFAFGLLAGLALASLPSRPDLSPAAGSPVDSESYSADGFVYLRFGETRYEFAPNDAQAIGRGLILSAESAQ